MSTKVITVRYEEGKDIDELADYEVLAVLHHNVSVGSARLLVRELDGEGHQQQTLEMVDAEELAEAYKEQARESGRALRNELRGTTIPATSEDEPLTVTCAGKGGECSRKVDAEGDRCWQHSEESE